MEYTPNYNLAKQAEDEFYDVDVINDNLDKIDVALGDTHTHSNKSILDEITETKISNWNNSVNNKANKSVVTTTTLTSSTWVGTSAPYTYTRAVTGVTVTNIVEVTYPSTITDAQLTAYEAAQIKKITQTTGSITLYAYGAKPTISLPITIIVRGDV